MSEKNAKIQLKFKLIDGYDFYCERCGSNKNINEFEAFLDSIYHNNYAIIDETFIVDKLCQCGCNLFYSIPFNWKFTSNYRR